MSKCIDLTGANITFTDRLTNEKISNYVNNNLDLFANEYEDDEEKDYALYIDHSHFNDGRMSFEFVYLKSSNGWIVRSREDIWEEGILYEYDNDASLQNLQSNSLTPNGLLQNRAFIDFITDVCDIEGGIWEAETPSAIITYNGSETTVLSGQTATLPCSNRVMKTDVVISIK